MDKEKKNNRTGIVVSFSIHALLILLFVFGFSCWKAPGPPWPGPNPEDVVTVDIGDSFTGMGDSQIESENVTDSDEENEEEQEPEIVEPTEPTEEEPIDDVVEENPITEDPLDAVDNGDPIQQDEPSQEAKQLYDPTSSTGGKGNDEQPGNKGSEDGVDSEKSGKGDNGLIKIGGWSKVAEPDFKDDIKHGASMEFEFHVNELGQIEQIIWIHSSLTPSERVLIEKRLKSELKLKAKDGEKQNTKGTYRIDFQ